MEQRLIDASQIENKFLHWLNEISKDITNGIYQDSESDGIAACLEEIREAPTIDPESLRPRGHWESPSKLLNIVNCTAQGRLFLLFIRCSSGPCPPAGSLPAAAGRRGG